MGRHCRCGQHHIELQRSHRYHIVSTDLCISINLAVGFADDLLPAPRGWKDRYFGSLWLVEVPVVLMDHANKAQRELGGEMFLGGLKA